jgi:hypothetical protein
MSKLGPEVWDKNCSSKTIGDPNNPSHPFGAEKLGLPSDLTYTVVPAYDQNDTYLKGSTWLDEAIQAQLRPVPCGRSLQCQ